MRILAIETTCDETAAAVLENGGTLLSSVVYSQVARHRVYNGVVPELASRAHCEKIASVIAEALKPAIKKTAKGRPPVDAVAFSCGPGLPGGLVVGKVAAQAVAALYGVPVIGVNHLEGHLYSCELEGEKRSRPLKFPLVALIISGGHTELWHVRKYGCYRMLGKTRDDAAGEAFDKVAKLLGLAYPGGPAVEKKASAGSGAVRFTKPLLPGTWEFSFSGLKTAVSYYLRDHKDANPAQVCAAFQDALVSTVTAKALAAAQSCRVKHIAVGGGVAANGALRERLSREAKALGMTATFVERRHCSDNAAMIAVCAWHMHKAGAGKDAAINPALKLRSWGGK